MSDVRFSSAHCKILCTVLKPRATAVGKDHDRVTVPPIRDPDRVASVPVHVVPAHVVTVNGPAKEIAAIAREMGLGVLDLVTKLPSPLRTTLRITLSVIITMIATDLRIVIESETATENAERIIVRGTKLSNSK